MPDVTDIQTLIYYWSLVSLSTAAILMNSVVILIVIRYRQRLFFRKNISRKRKAANHNKLLISVTFGDLLVGITGVITGVLLKTGQDRRIYKLFGTIPMAGVMITSLLSLVFMTIDQLVAIKFPYRYNDYLNCSRVTKIIGLTWIFPVFFTAAQVLVYVKTDSRTELRARNFILTIFFLAGFIILIISNYNLLQVVRAQHGKFATKDGKQQNLPSCSPRKDNGKLVKRITCKHCPKVPAQCKKYLSPDTARGQDKRHSICLPVQQPLANDQSTINRYTPSCSDMRLDARDADDQQLCFSVKPTCHQSHNASCNSGNSENRSVPSVTSLTNLKTQCRLSVNHTLHNSDISGNSLVLNSPSLTNSTTHSKLPVNYDSLSTSSNLQYKIQAITPSSSKLTTEKRIRIMCIWIIIVFLICWLPHIGYRFSHFVGRKASIRWFRRLTQCLALSNSLMNPCIYFLLRSDFCQMLKELIGIQRKQV